MRHLKTYQQLNELHQDTYDSYNNKRLMNFLLDNGIFYKESDFHSLSYEGFNELLKIASSKGSAKMNQNIELVDLLLKHPRVDPSYRKNIAFIYAVDDGNLEIVKRLLEDPRVDPSDRNNKALEFAFNGKNNRLKEENILKYEEIIKLLASDTRVQETSGLTEEEIINSNYI